MKAKIKEPLGHVDCPFKKDETAKVKSIDQVGTSDIIHWLRLYILRKVQIMAGHRYINSTENNKADNIDDLKGDI